MAQLEAQGRKLNPCGACVQHLTTVLLSKSGKLSYPIATCFIT